MIDLDSAGYSDDGIPLEDLEGVDTAGERYAAEAHAHRERVASGLRAAGIVCQPSDTVYRWVTTAPVVQTRTCRAATRREAEIRLGTTHVRRAKGSGCDDEYGVPRSRRV